MSTRAGTLPTLFGRATVVHGEHANLAGMVAELRAVCTRMTDRASPAERDVSELFKSFSLHLSLHFASEESADYFGAVVTECPWLDDGVSHLKRDHERMTAMLQSLRPLADGVTPSGEFAAWLVELLDRLGAHEKHERLLLQEFFGRGDWD